MKKKHFFIGALVLIAMIIIFVMIYDNQRIVFIQERLGEENYVVVKTRDGSSGDELTAEKVNYLIDLLVESELKRQITLLPKGGWSYLIELKINNQAYKIIFSSNNTVKINGRLYLMEGTFE